MSGTDRKTQPIPSTMEVVDARTHEIDTTPTPIEQPNIAGIIEKIALDPNCNMDNVERLFELHRKEKADFSLLSFNKSFAAAQAEMPAVVKDAENKHTDSVYATLGAMIRTIKPIAAKHGFAMIGDTDPTPPDGFLRVIVDLVHKDGHSRRHTYDSPITTKGAKGNVLMTETHARGSAVTYAQRYLKGLIWDMELTEDDDGNAAGSATISFDQVAEIRDLLVDLNKGESRLKTLMGVESIDQIPANDFSKATGALQQAITAQNEKAEKAKAKHA